MTFKVSDPNKAKQAAAEAARAKAAAAKDSSGIEPIKFIPAEDCPDKNRIVFDDSGSMGSYIEQAKDGVVEYLRYCIPNKTAIGIDFLNSVLPELEKLESNLLLFSKTVKNSHLSSGGTPLFTTMKLSIEKNLTRMICFTDGSPTDDILESQRDWHRTSTLDRWKENADVIIATANSRKIPIDTVFFGSAHHENEIALLKYFSDKTGGYFLHFDPAKVNFAQAFKYLAPANRMMLVSESVRKEIESGKRA